MMTRRNDMDFTENEIQIKKEIVYNVGNAFLKEVMHYEQEMTNALFTSCLYDLIISIIRNVTEEEDIERHTMLVATALVGFYTTPVEAFFIFEGRDLDGKPTFKETKNV
jgi:hypothetical protein